jgi:hypothetical protein
MLTNNEWMTDVTAQAGLTKNRFIGYDGNYTGAGEQAKGILKFDQVTGKKATLVYGGTALLELGENVTAIGTELQSGANGVGMIASVADEFVNAIALGVGNSGDTITVQLTKYKV